jgi:putative transposase
LFESSFLFGLLASLCLPREGTTAPVAQLLAENRALKIQLAMFAARKIEPRRPTAPERIALAFWSMMFDWRDSLFVVQPETLIRWQRKLVRLDWAWISKVWTRRAPTGRKPIDEATRTLILRLAIENPLWTSRRIAAELRTKFGIEHDRKTVAKYMPREASDGGPRRGQSWLTFVRNHVGVTIACDFATVPTALCKWLYVFVVMELGTRRVLHVNVTAHPTAAWVSQQLREAIPADHRYRFLVRDRDALYSPEVEQTIRALGVRSLRTPYRAPRANAFCERLIGTMRRELLDHIIPRGERHLRKLLADWKSYYNRARPHMSLGDSPPDPPGDLPVPLRESNRLPAGARIEATPYMGGLHHDYRVAA